jgi:hypothetical protein
MPAVPALIGVAGSLGSAWLGSRAAKSAMQRSPEELDALTANTALARQSATQGSQLFSRSMPAVGNALNYYQTLLSGNRAARTAAMAPEAESVANAYEGANQAINRGYVRGGVRDTALAENARAKAGQIARLTTGVRPMAAQGMADIGSRLMGAGQQSVGTAAGINQGTIASGTQNRLIGMQAGQETTRSLGAIFARLLALYGQRVPSTTTPKPPNPTNIPDSYMNPSMYSR